MMTAQKANKRLIKDLRTVTRDAEALARAGADQASGKLDEARNRLAGAVDSVRTAYRQVGDRTLATAKATDHCIRNHPYETIGVGFGLGLLVGALVRRR
jgi:ElaB/YqjD/DUF883 family membrane-anchored ribosome-binding protein